MSRATNNVSKFLAVFVCLPIIAPVWLVLGILAKVVNWSQAQVREFLQ